MIPPPPRSTLFPSPTLSRSLHVVVTSSEGTSSTTSSADIAVTVNPVAEAASLTGTVLTASGNEGTAIDLTNRNTTRLDSNHRPIYNSGFPSNTSLNHGTLNP